MHLYYSQSGGLRQGVPISPYIFVLHLERLAHLIQKEVDEGHWKTLRASRHGPGISHLFFADDLVLFVDSSCVQMRVIKKCLEDFTMASRQRINLEKSKVFFSPNFSKEEAAMISSESGIPTTEGLGQYLGTRLVHHRHGKALYTQLLDDTRRRWTCGRQNTYHLRRGSLWPTLSS